MTAQHDDHPPLFPDGGGYRLDNAPEVARDQNIGQRFEKFAEAAVRGGWRRGSELTGGNLVRPPLDGNRADSGKICFARAWFTA
ncbi:MAG TPA: hypothetical protein VFS56_01585 [Gemmatimonadaceae bacterium]|nr:hypothetical protein [Gemmatimonadaceae bacterium]